MENSAKAFYWGGGILIGILVISIFYYIFSQASILMKETQTDTEQKELMKFNKSFEAYNKKIMYGADIITLMNKAIDNNEKYYKKIRKETGKKLVDQPYFDYFVDIKFTYKGNTYSLVEHYYNNKDKNDIEISKSVIWNTFLDKKIENYDDGDKKKEFLRAFKFVGFKCTETEYKTEEQLNVKSHGPAIGRICSMTFVEFK